jgi:hypothetical protein
MTTPKILGKSVPVRKAAAPRPQSREAAVDTGSASGPEAEASAPPVAAPVSPASPFRALLWALGVALVSAAVYLWRRSKRLPLHPQVQEPRTLESFEASHAEPPAPREGVEAVVLDVPRPAPEVPLEARTPVPEVEVEAPPLVAQDPVPTPAPDTHEMGAPPDLGSLVGSDATPAPGPQDEARALGVPGPGPEAHDLVRPSPTAGTTAVPGQGPATEGTPADPIPSETPTSGPVPASAEPEKHDRDVA